MILQHGNLPVFAEQRNEDVEQESQGQDCRAEWQSPDQTECLQGELGPPAVWIDRHTSRLHPIRGKGQEVGDSSSRSSCLPTQCHVDAGRSILAQIGRRKQYDVCGRDTPWPAVTRLHRGREACYRSDAWAGGRLVRAFGISDALIARRTSRSRPPKG